jgi:hypothetical protein
MNWLSFMAWACWLSGPGPGWLGGGFFHAWLVLHFDSSYRNIRRSYLIRRNVLIHIEGKKREAGPELSIRKVRFSLTLCERFSEERLRSSPFLGRVT